MSPHIRDDPSLPDGVGINEETGEFVSLEDHGMHSSVSTEVMADGGVPARVVEQSYPGSQAYTSIETVHFSYEAVNSNLAADDDDVNFTEEVFDLDNLLDRREEMADLLHLDVSFQIKEAFSTDGTLTDEPAGGRANALLSAPVPERNDPIELNVRDMSDDPGTGDDVSASDSEEPLCRPLQSSYTPRYENTTDGAGGGAGGSSIDSTRVSGWQMSDPSFEARDVIGAAVTIENQGELELGATLNGQMTFGLYEVQTTEVVR
jgi:hypothetical protein